MAERGEKKGSGGSFAAMQDPYERRARLAPALLTMVPLAVALSALPTGELTWLKPLIGVISAMGGTLLLAAIARSAGRGVQQDLFPDGLPTVVRLRHRAPGATKAEVAKLHGDVTKATGIALPSSSDEDADPAEADGVYRTACAELIRLTRDQSRFEHLAKENVNYGFMRNLYGLRSIGKVLAAGGAAAGVGLLIVGIANDDGLDIGLAIATIIVSAISMFVFFVWLRPERVEVPATSYADRLFEAASTLASTP